MRNICLETHVIIFTLQKMHATCDGHTLMSWIQKAIFSVTKPETTYQVTLQAFAALDIFETIFTKV